MSSGQKSYLNVHYWTEHLTFRKLIFEVTFFQTCLLSSYSGCLYPLFLWLGTSCSSNIPPADSLVKWLRKSWVVQSCSKHRGKAQTARRAPFCHLDPRNCSSCPLKLWEIQAKAQQIAQIRCQAYWLPTSTEVDVASFKWKCGRSRFQKLSKCHTSSVVNNRSVLSTIGLTSSSQRIVGKMTDNVLPIKAWWVPVVYKVDYGNFYSKDYNLFWESQDPH